MSLLNVFIEYILQWCDTHHFSFKNVWTKKKKRKEKMCEQAFKIMWKCSLPIWNFTSFLSELIFQFFVPHYVSAFSSVQSLSHVQLFVTPWTAAHQASLSFTNSQSLLKFMYIESVMPFSHLIRKFLPKEIFFFIFLAFTASTVKSGLLRYSLQIIELSTNRRIMVLWFW